MPRFRRPLLATGVALLLTAPFAVPQDLPPPAPADLARGLRENGLADLALEYLTDLSAGKPTPEVATLLPLERAKCRLELANLETDEAVRGGLVDEATADFDRFLAANAKHPRAPEASVARARLLTLEGKARLQQAKKLTDEATRRDAAAKARPLFEDAAKRYDATAGLEKLADSADPSRKAELVRDFYQAVLDRGINQYTLADAYLDPKGKEIDAKVKALNEAVKTFDGLWQRDIQHPLCWVARAWVGETYLLLGEPRKADAAFKELLAEAKRTSAPPAAAAGLRAARFFQLREQFVRLQNDPVGRSTVRDACRTWLRDYPAARPTAEIHAVWYYLGTVLLKEATKAENMQTEPVKADEPKGAVKVVGLKADAKDRVLPLLREAEAEFRRIALTDNEYTDRAVRQRAQALRWLIGDVDRPPAEFPSFDQCYTAALVQVDRLRDTPAAERTAVAGKAIALLERALTLPVPKESARDVVPVKVALAQTYNAANQPRKAAALAEGVCRDPANARNSSLVARTGLIALYGYQMAGQGATAGVEAQAADRDRMIALCGHVEKVAPNDPNTDEVRLQHGVLLSQAGRGLEAFEAFARIPVRYPRLALARLYLGIAAYELVRPRGANEAAQKGDLPADKKADVSRRAVAALNVVPVPPKAVRPEESTAYVRVRLQLAQLHLTAGAAGYPAAEKVAADVAGVLAQFPDVPGDQKQALVMRAESLRAKAVYGQAWPLYLEGKFAAAADRFAPLLAEVVKGGPATKPGQDGELADAARQLDADRTRLVLVPTLNARIREGAVEKTGVLLDQLKKFGGDVATTARVVQQGIAGVRPTVDALRKEGKADEAAKLVAAVTGMVDKLAAEKNLPAEVRINLGRAFKDLGEYGKAAELLTQVPAPADPAFLPGDPKVNPPDNEPADVKQKREAAFEANKTAAAFYRLAQLELHRCFRLSLQFDKCDALLDEVLGKDRKGGWGQKFPDFRRESLLLSEAKAAAAATPKEATPHWNAAMQGWRGWANEYKAAIDGLKAKADDPEEKVNEVRRKKEGLKPTWFDLTAEQYRCTVAAQLAVYKADPAKLAAGLGSQARGIVDFEKTNAPLPTGIKAKLFQLVETYPELKEAYTKAGGIDSLKAPVIDP